MTKQDRKGKRRNALAVKERARIHRRAKRNAKYKAKRKTRAQAIREATSARRVATAERRREALAANKTNGIITAKQSVLAKLANMLKAKETTNE